MQGKYLLMKVQKTYTRRRVLNLEIRKIPVNCMRRCLKRIDYSPVWTMSDSEKDCQFDIHLCILVKDTTSITDLDADGTAEITLYRLVCRSDIACRNETGNVKERIMLKGFTWYGSPEDKFWSNRSKMPTLNSLRDIRKRKREFMKTWGQYESKNLL